MSAGWASTLDVFDNRRENDRMATSAFRVGAVLVLLVALAACGGGDASDTTGSSQATPDSTVATDSTTAGSTVPDSTETTAAEPATDMPDPCAALTTEEISTATGVAFGDGVFSDLVSNEFQVACDWTVDGNALPAVQVLIIPGSADFISDARSSAEEIFEVSDVAIPGATDAFYAAGLLGMAIGSDFVQVSYLTTGQDDLEATTQMATIVAGRLGG